MFKEKLISGEFVAGASLALALCLGTTACTNSENHAATQATITPSPLSDVPTSNCALALELFSVDHSSPEGGAYAINEGDCANVYDKELANAYDVTGQIPAGETFYVECYDLTAAGLRVNIKGLKGFVDLSEYALQRLDDDPSAHQIRTC